MLHLLFVLIFIFDKKKEEEPEVLGKEKKIYRNCNYI
jgi:hypothetical protein